MANTWPVVKFVGEKQECTIPPELQHVVQVYAFRGMGKTTFALGVDHPDNVLMLDYESKGEGLAVQLGLKNYFSVQDECTAMSGINYSPHDIFDRTKQIINAVPKDRFTAVIIDNIALLQEGCVEEVKRFPTRYGILPMNAQKGSFGGAYPGVKYLLKSMFSELRAKGVQVIVITSHVKTAWAGDKPLLGKFKAVGLDIIAELSVLSLALVPGAAENLGCPAAVVAKEQLAKIEWKDGKLDVVRRLPLRLPKATFSEVKDYLANPANLTNPRPGEVPTREEIDPFLPTFSKEQIQFVKELLEVSRLFSPEAVDAEGGGEDK